MLPAASVCGYYFAHPQAEYFVLGPVLPDQLEDYARRKDCSVDEVRRLLPSNLHDSSQVATRPGRRERDAPGHPSLESRRGRRRDPREIWRTASSASVSKQVITSGEVDDAELDPRSAPVAAPR